MSSSETAAAGVTPLPAGDPEGLRDASISIAPERLEALHRRAFIREHEFRSTVPLVGRLIAAFRRLWNQVSTRWYVRAAVQQQIEFNAEAAAILDHLAREVQALATQQREVMREQFGFNAHVSAAIQQLGEDERALWAQFNQQFEFNQGMANSLDGWARRVGQLEYDRQRLAEVFAAYMSESGRELGELAWELQRLQTSLDTVAAEDTQ